MDVLGAHRPSAPGPSRSWPACTTRRCCSTIHLSGDMGMYAAFGAAPYFLLSIGGYHPDFQPPSELPAAVCELERMRADVAISDDVALALEAYVAVTSNTLQFGAGVSARGERQVPHGDLHRARLGRLRRAARVLARSRSRRPSTPASASPPVRRQGAAGRRPVRAADGAEAVDRRRHGGVRLLRPRRALLGVEFGARAGRRGAGDGRRAGRGAGRAGRPVGLARCRTGASAAVLASDAPTARSCGCARTASSRRADGRAAGPHARSLRRLRDRRADDARRHRRRDRRRCRGRPRARRSTGSRRRSSTTCRRPRSWPRRRTRR